MSHGFVKATSSGNLTAKYILQEASSDLPNAQDLASLSTGYVKVTGVTGVLSSQVAPIPVSDGGTGQDTEQLAINALTAVGAATNEHVLTKDTGSGNAMWKAAAGSDLVNDTTPQLGGQLDVNGNAIGDGTLELLKFVETGSAVNEVTITNAATGNGPTISATGDDTNIDLNLTAKGTGKVKFSGSTLGIYDTSNNELVLFTETASAVNELTIVNAATGNNPTISATGGDTNIGITISGKGTGATTIRVKPRINSTASSATPSINTDTTDQFNITALAAAITSMTTNLSGTPNDGQKLIIRFKDDGTGRAITWGASFASRGGTLPTTTVATKLLYVGLIWNSTASTWDCVGTAQEA